MNSLSNQENFDENVVMSKIFRDARTNEPRGFSDAFTDEEVLELWSSDHVYNTWSRSNKDWLDNTAGVILDKRLGII